MFENGRHGELGGGHSRLERRQTRRSENLRDWEVVMEYRSDWWMKEKSRWVA